MVLFKIVLLQHLNGSMLRGTLRRAETDAAYRWFLQYRLSEELPHFSTVSYNFLHWYTPETIDAVFRWILDEAGAAGALTPTAVFIDGTHIKANANLKKKIKQEVPAAAKRYGEELLAEINAGQEAHGKKPFDDKDELSKSNGRKPLSGSLLTPRKNTLCVIPFTVVWPRAPGDRESPEKYV